MFVQVVKLEQEFIFHVSHLERIVEIYNDRLNNWKTEKLQDLVESVPHQVTFQVLFKHAGETRLDMVHFGRFVARIPNTQEALWILVADDETLNRQLVLITNIPLTGVPAAVQQVYNDWRLRSLIEYGYRFDQEQGFDVEDIRIQTVDRMRRLFAVVLMVVQIVFVISTQWSPKDVLWLRQLGSKLGISTDREPSPPNPFPFQEFTCG